MQLARYLPRAARYTLAALLLLTSTAAAGGYDAAVDATGSPTTVVIVLGHGAQPVRVDCMYRGACVVRHPERYNATERCRWRVDAHRVLQGKRPSRFLPRRCWTRWMRRHLHPDPSAGR